MAHFASREREKISFICVHFNSSGVFGNFVHRIKKSNDLIKIPDHRRTDFISGVIYFH